MLTKYGDVFGRRATITLELVIAICVGVDKGLSLRGAAGQVGVYQQLAYAWRKRGEQLDLTEDLDHSKLSPAERLYILLARGLCRAEATVERRHLEALLQALAAEPDWRGHAWFLERRFPEQWSGKQQVRVELVPDGAAAVEPGAPVVDVVPFDQLLRAIWELADKQGLELQAASEPAQEVYEGASRPQEQGTGTTAAGPVYMCAEGVHTNHPERRGHCANPDCSAYAVYGFQATPPWGQ